MHINEEIVHKRALKRLRKLLVNSDEEVTGNQYLHPTKILDSKHLPTLFLLRMNIFH